MTKEPLLLDKIFALKDQIKEETDSEMLELMHMELADLEWLISAGLGEKPSDVWDEYKTEHGLSFNKVAA